MAAPVIPCDDSAVMQGLILIGPPPPAPPCTDHLNPPPGQAPGQRWAQRPCTDCAKPPGPIQHLVCGSCYEHQRARNDHIYQNIVSMSPLGQPNGLPMLPIAPGNSARSNMATPVWPPLPPPGVNPTGRFTDFWTRLCVPCERMEQDKFERAIFDHNLLLPLPTYQPAANTLDMWDYPWNTCTCLKLFGWVGNVRQPPDTNRPLPFARNPAQPAIRTTSGPPNLGLEKEYNCTHHGCFQFLMNIRLNARDANDDWLRTTARSASGKLCIASARTRARRDRAASSSHRACRCGGDADTKPYDAEVLLCMACEGLWCLRRKGTPGSKYQNMQMGNRRRRNAPNTNVTSRGRTVGDMTLGRPRENFTDERAY